MNPELLKYEWNQMQERFAGHEKYQHFSKQMIDQIHRFQSSHRNYTQTPLIRLKALAKTMQVGNVFVKDESHRFGLNAFKVLGGIYVIGRYIAEQLGMDFADLTIEKLTSEKLKRKTGMITFASATDGNHGRGIAWAARELGHRAIIYLPKGAVQERVEVIRQEGAEAVVTDMNYDDTVRHIAKDAKQNGWVVVQDTSWDGYEKIPEWIMQGYATLTKEIMKQLERYSSNLAPTHVFLQAGVGSYAAAIVAAFVARFGENHPKFILAEPHQANCYYKSFVASDHAYRTVEGDLDTIMAGLSCGEPNPQAWSILKKYIDVSFSCDDRISALGMRILGNPLQDDERIISGEAGSVTTGLLYRLMTDPQYDEVRDKLQLDESANVILINTEGDTDTAHYREVAWEGRHPLG